MCSWLILNNGSQRRKQHFSCSTLFIYRTYLTWSVSAAPKQIHKSTCVGGERKRERKRGRRSLFKTDRLIITRILKAQIECEWRVVSTADCCLTFDLVRLKGGWGARLDLLSRLKREKGWCLGCRSDWPGLDFIWRGSRHSRMNAFAL